MTARAHLHFIQTEATDAFDAAVVRAGIGAPTPFADAIDRLDQFHDDTLLRCPSDACPRHVLTDFTTARLSSDDPIALASVVTTLDTESTWHALTGRSPGTASAVTVAAQIEHATTVVLTEWRALDTESVTLLVALLGHLNPSASLVLLGSDSSIGVDDGRHRDIASAVMANAGWMHVLSGTFTPRTVHDRVATFRYENVRPFHPGRLAELFSDDSDGGGRIVRSAGFFTISSRPDEVALWDQCGTAMTFSLLRHDHSDGEPLTIGQDIAFTGVDLDVARLTTELDACVLDDDELLAGAESWTRWPDPLPRWDE
ncbi:GTP-binding protein [Rhodococcus gannanensis]|uniref:GTP-binding protein n=1 Tax=Rhodococcus gannanensis TaxID=1960308 RepID=A0ABW4P3V0_9NOCA